MSLAGLGLLASCTQVEASNCGMGNSVAKAFGDVLLVNKTLQHLNVSNNSFGKVQIGDKVTIKGGNTKLVLNTFPNTDYLQLEGDGDAVKYGRENYSLVDVGIPALCAGLAACPSLLSVSISICGNWSLG